MPHLHHLAVARKARNFSPASFTLRTVQRALYADHDHLGRQFHLLHRHIRQVQWDFYVHHGSLRCACFYSLSSILRPYLPPTPEKGREPKNLKKELAQINRTLKALKTQVMALEKR